MKSLLVVCVLLLVAPGLLAQESKAPAKDSSRSDEPRTAPAPLLQNPPMFPMRIGSKKMATSGIRAQGFQGGIYGSDYLTVSNNGQPGVLILGLGDEFNGVMANYLACDIWAIKGQQGWVNWNDGTPNTPMFFVPPLWSRQAGTTKTPQQTGTFNVTVTIWNQCDDNWRHNIITNGVSNTAIAHVYDSIPISNFQINCAAASPCPSVKGGQLASGVVTNTTPPPATGGGGTLVLISISGPATTVSYIIEPVGQQTVSFDMLTTPVASNTPLTVSVYSGGTTKTGTITVTP
jgi:hypothetical protein